MSGNAHDGSNMEPVAKRLRALKGSLGMVIEQSPLAIHVLTPDGFPLLSNSSWKTCGILVRIRRAETSFRTNSCRLRA